MFCFLYLFFCLFQQRVLISLFLGILHNQNLKAGDSEWLKCQILSKKKNKLKKKKKKNAEQLAVRLVPYKCVEKCA